MSDKKITDLTSAGTLDGTELFPVAQGGESRRLLLSGVSSYVIGEISKTDIDALNVDADTLDGQHGAHYLDYNNFTNTPTIGNATITFSAGTGLTGGGNFTTDQSSPETITFNVDMSAFDTGDLAEGTNLYYTTARANSAIDARVDKAFVDALNVDADTLDGQNGSYYTDYNNLSNTPNDAKKTKQFFLATM